MTMNTALPQAPGTYGARLTALREELRRQKLDGFVVPLTDEHLSEYVGSYAQRLGWLTGFGGSAGAAVVLLDRAAIFVDGRYTLQVRKQVDAEHWSYQSVPETTVEEWLGQHGPRGGLVGYDPWLHTQGWVEKVHKELAKRDAKLVAVPTNPLDVVWIERPAPSADPLVVHPERFAGKSALDKRREMSQWLQKNHCDAVVLCALDSIAWAFNVRGTDIARNPVALAYALIRVDGTADLFVTPGKCSPQVQETLGDEVVVRTRNAFPEALDELAGKRVSIDLERTVAAICQRLVAAGAQLVEAREPVVLAKAIKNTQEIAGMKSAHVRDGAALTRFLHWVETVASQGGQDEFTAAQRLLEYRREIPALRDLSFDTISGAGPNAALPHYQVSQQSARAIERNSLYLVDSGGQYLDGTTDVTRTVVVGEATDEMRDRFTRVLKGHIALARAVFPAGTTGAQLDTLARQYLWQVGLDFNHGTGHGVGSYLNVHEGPQRIGKRHSEEPLQAGMVLSNEPGYYKSGAYGIRVENLMLVEAREVEGAEKPVLGFETLTLAPIDLSLVAAHLLDAHELIWLNNYHARVYAEIAPLVPDEIRPWLAEATRPIS
jgi:Xaa-Pro aminopeptidase